MFKLQNLEFFISSPTLLFLAMVNFITEEEIVEINRKVLEISDELDDFQYRHPNYIRFTLKFVEDLFEGDYHKAALAYCISVIVHHAFKNGNHRTSMISAEVFLNKNNFKSLTTDKKDIELYKKRVEMEEKDDLTLIRKFFNSIEDPDKIIEIMESEYGQMIEKWLRDNYIKEDN